MSSSSGATEPGERILVTSEQTLAATHVSDRGTAGEAAPEIARGTEIGRYLVVQEIGHGATGRVWVAYDGDLDRRVAIKLVAESIADRPERRQQLLGEAQAMAKMRHPNVVLVHDVGTYQGHLYIAMEFVEGTTLGRWWRSEPRPTTTALLDAFIAAARGLAAAHAAGLVHRDFKPDNVLIAGGAPGQIGDARVKVADFGLAQPLGDADAAAPRQTSGAGTPAYMSPEHHGGVVDARSDQFSFCIALFEALAGRRPFRGDTPAAIASATIRGELDEAAAAAIPPRLRRIVVRGLAARPEARHATMDALVVALERAQRRRWPLVLGGVVAASLAASAWVLVPGTEPLEDCKRGQLRADAIWTDARRDALRLAPEDLGAAATRATEERTIRQLDAYASSWAELHDAMCGRRAESHDATMAARVACVEDRLAGFTGIVEYLDAHTVGASTIARLLERLPPLAQCKREDAGAWQPLPSDPEQAARVAGLRERLRVSALRGAAGELEAAEHEQLEIVEDAREIGYTHTLAHALSELAATVDQRGRTSEASRYYDEALGTAVAGGYDWLGAVIIAHNLEQMGHNPALDSDAERWAMLGEALLARGGGDDEILTQILVAQGGVYFARGDFARALEQFERAEAVLRRADGDRLVIASVQLNSAVALSELGRRDEAWRLAEAANGGLEAELGPDHVSTIRARHIIGLVEDSRGNLDSAIDHVAGALAGIDRLEGDRSRERSAMAYNLARILARRGRTTEAAELLARSRREWPVEGDRFADAQFEEIEAMIAMMAGDATASLQHADRMLERFAGVTGKRDVALLTGSQLRGEALLELRRYPEALAQLEELWPRLGEVTPPTVVRVAIAGTLAAYGRGDPLATAVWLARLEPLRGLDRDQEIMRRFARTVVVGNRSNDIVAELQRDRDRLVELGSPSSPQVRCIDGWIARTWP